MVHSHGAVAVSRLLLPFLVALLCSPLLGCVGGPCPQRFENTNCTVTDIGIQYSACALDAPLKALHVIQVLDFEHSRIAGAPLKEGDRLSVDLTVTLSGTCSPYSIKGFRLLDE
jgi:hypothetical protein